MTHETTLEIWRMSDNRRYARLVNRHTGEASWWKMKKLADDEVLLLKATAGEGQKLSSEFFHERRSASQGTFFPE